MTQATVNNATVGFFEILLRNYLDDEFRERIEADELKQPSDDPEEVLHQFDPEDLREVSNLATEFKQWVDGRVLAAQKRQGKGQVPTDIRPDELTPAFAAVERSPGHSFGPGGP